MTPIQSPTLASQATAELPLQGLSSWLHHMARRFPEDGPTLLAWAKEVTAIAAVPLSCRDSHEASLKYVEGYEAGRASRAQSEWIRVEDERKPVGRKPILVAVQWMNHYEHEDGTPARQEGCDVTEGEYVPQHGDRSGYFDSYAGPYDHDGWGITHWQPLPSAPANLGETK